jgi:hypothetical protein
MHVNMNDLLTTCAILVALVTWWVTFLQARRTERVARTAEIIANLSVAEALAEATYQVTRLINAGVRVRYESLDESSERHVVKILDYYEYMCDLYESGILSKKTIIALRGNLMARTWETCEDYILETRRRQGRQVYAAFERFVGSLPGRTSLATILPRPAVTSVPPASASSSPIGDPGAHQSLEVPGLHQPHEGSAEHLLCDGFSPSSASRSVSQIGGYFAQCLAFGSWPWGAVSRS